MQNPDWGSIPDSYQRITVPGPIQTQE